jgi:5-methylcytosine-specific restriction endonuclease McrA
MTSRRRPSDSSPAWQALRRRVLIRARFVCYWCSGRANEADHLVALADGGAALDLRNLVAACRSCNARRGGELRQRQAAVPARRSRSW